MKSSGPSEFQGSSERNNPSRDLQPSQRDRKMVLVVGIVIETANTIVACFLYSQRNNIIHFSKKSVKIKI